MGSPTTRLQLLKPAGTDVVNVLTQINANYDKIDQWAGAILVNDGVTPPDAALFDGAIVKEKTSGQVWIAQWNGTGYDHKPVTHAPWIQLCAAGSTTGVGGSNTTAATGGIWYRQEYGTVRFLGAVGPTSGAWVGNPALFTVPVGYRPVGPAGGPAQQFIMPSNAAGNGDYVIGRVQTNGVVILLGAMSGGPVTTGRSYDLDQITYAIS